MPYLLDRRAFLSAGCAAALPARAAKPRRWALLSDTHAPADPANVYRGFQPHENLRKAAAQVAAADADAALICGDLARLEGLPGDYQALRSLLAPVTEKMPLACLLGNHDNRANFLAAFPDPPDAQPVKDRHVVSIAEPNARLVLLDSLIAPNTTPGLLGKLQRTWLASHLDAGAGLPVVLFVHHTLDDGDGSLLDAPRLFDIVRPRRHVKAIVFGHSHRYGYGTVDGIHLVNLPAVGYSFQDSEPVGWVECELRPGGASFTLRAFAGNTAQNGKTVSLDWRA